MVLFFEYGSNTGIYTRINDRDAINIDDDKLTELVLILVMKGLLDAADVSPFLRTEVCAIDTSDTKSLNDIGYKNDV